MASSYLVVSTSTLFNFLIQALNGVQFLNITGLLFVCGATAVIVSLTGRRHLNLSVLNTIVSLVLYITGLSHVFPCKEEVKI